MVRRGLPGRPDTRAASRLARHRRRRIDADSGAHRIGQDAGGVSLVPEPADVSAATGQTAALPGALRLAPQGPRHRRRAQSPRAARRHRPGRRGGQRAGDDADGGDSDGRHARRGPSQIPARAGGSAHHHARIAVPAAHLERARRAAIARDDHHRRDSCAGADQAGGAPGALARAAGGAGRGSRAADRIVRDAAPAGRSRPVPRRHQSSGGTDAGDAIEIGARGQATPERRGRGPARHPRRVLVGPPPVVAIPAGDDCRCRREAAAETLDRGASRGHVAARTASSSRAARPRPPAAPRSGRRSIRGWSISFARTARR